MKQEKSMSSISSTSPPIKGSLSTRNRFLRIPNTRSTALRTDSHLYTYVHGYSWRIWNTRTFVAHIYVEYIHIFVEIRGRGGVWGRIRHSLARKPSVDSIGGVLLAAHSLHPVVVPRVAQCHAALELVHGSRGVLGRCRPAALQEERVGFHLAHQIVAAHAMVLSLVAPAKIVVAYLIQPVAVQCRLTTIVG